MGAKVYVLIDAAAGKTCQVITMLSGKPGVLSVDSLQRPPDVVMVAEAENTRKLIELTLQAMVSVEHLIDSAECLPVVSDDFCPVNSAS